MPTLRTAARNVLTYHYPNRDDAATLRTFLNWQHLAATCVPPGLEPFQLVHDVYAIVLDNQHGHLWTYSQQDDADYCYSCGDVLADFCTALDFDGDDEEDPDVEAETFETHHRLQDYRAYRAGTDADEDDDGGGGDDNPPNVVPFPPTPARRFQPAA